MKSESYGSYGVVIGEVESFAYGDGGVDDICEFDSSTDCNECRSSENEACEVHFEVVEMCRS